MGHSRGVGPIPKRLDRGLGGGDGRSSWRCDATTAICGAVDVTSVCQREFDRRRPELLSPWKARSDSLNCCVDGGKWSTEFTKQIFIRFEIFGGDLNNLLHLGKI